MKNKKVTTAHKIKDNLIKFIDGIVSEQLKGSMMLKAFSLTKVPLIFLVNPSVLLLDDHECQVKIPLNRITRNHLKSMYFGTLAIGADCVGGLLAMRLIQNSNKNISIVFKDFKANFLKRPEGDTVFICKEGRKIAKMVRQTIKNKARVSEPIEIIAVVPSKAKDEPVAEFTLTLSIKYISG